MSETMDNLETGAQEDNGGATETSEASAAVETKSEDNSKEQARLYADTFKTPEELEKGYLELRKDYSRKQEASVEEVKKKLLEEGDFVSKTDLEREKELASFLQERSDLKDRVPALQALQKTEDYRGKSLQDIAAELYGGPATTSANNRVVRKVELGETPRTTDFSDLSNLDEKAVRELPEDDFEALEKEVLSSGLVKK